MRLQDLLICVVGVYKFSMFADSRGGRLVAVDLFFPARPQHAASCKRFCNEGCSRRIALARPTLLAAHRHLARKRHAVNNSQTLEHDFGHIWSVSADLVEFWTDLTDLDTSIVFRYFRQDFAHICQIVPDVHFFA